jgi:hypothetical protein
MDVKEGLKDIRAMLVENRADRETVKMVDLIAQRASLPAAAGANADSVLQLVRMLMRNPVSAANVTVYNDLVKVESQLESQADEYRSLRAEEDRIANAKPKSYYKSLKKDAKK